jgi:hypothetical protein
VASGSDGIVRVLIQRRTDGLPNAVSDLIPRAQEPFMHCAACAGTWQPRHHGNVKIGQPIRDRLAYIGDVSRMTQFRTTLGVSCAIPTATKRKDDHSIGVVYRQKAGGVSQSNTGMISEQCLGRHKGRYF